MLKWQGKTDLMHSISAVMHRMIMNNKTQIRHLNMKHFGRDTQPRSQQYSVGVHTVHMLILTDLLSYNSSFDDATSDESWLNRQNVLNPKPKPPFL